MVEAIVDDGWSLCGMVVGVDVDRSIEQLQCVGLVDAVGMNARLMICLKLRRE